MKKLKKQMGFIEFLPLIGSAVSAAANFFGQEDTNDTNTMLANQNRSWQEQMSNTAHQREVADLTAAGLNPILSVNKGGSSTPGGNVPIIQNPWQNALSSASDAARAYADIRKKNQDYNIDKPKEQLYDEASKHIPKGLEAITGGISSTAETISAAVSAAVTSALKTDGDVTATPLDAVANTAKKLGDAVSQTSASSANRISNVTTQYARKMLDVVQDHSGSWTNKFMNSAYEAHRQIGERHVRGDFTRMNGPPSMVLEEIKTIGDPSLREKVKKLYIQQLNRTGYR